MITTSEIVKNYIEGIIKGNGLGLEEYVKDLFKGKNKDGLKQYCNDNNIFCKSRDVNRSDFLDRIYGSCNTQLSYKILMTSDIDNETTVDFYKRIWVRDYM